MCDFFSAILLRNGDLLHHWNTDSHSELILHYKLPDDRECRHFAKVEFTPPEDKDGRPDFANVDGYTLRIDEPTAPQWAEELREQTEKRCRSIVRDMLITDRRELIIDGCWIAADSAEIVRLRGGRVLSVSGSARVGFVYGSARVGFVYDSARVGSVYGSASVGFVYGSARVGSVYDSASVEVVYDSASVGSVSGSARVGFVYGSASVGSVYGSARVGAVYGSARVGFVYGSARVGAVYGSARVVNDNRSDEQKKANPIGTTKGAEA